MSLAGHCLGNVGPEAAEHEAVPVSTANEVKTTQESLASKAHLLQDPHGGRVIWVARGGQSLEAQLVEPELDEEARHFRRKTMTPAVPSNRVSQFADAVSRTCGPNLRGPDDLVAA